MPRLLKISEFAEICKTTRETLLHYDRKGILKPRYVMANGYRYYSASQWVAFDLISLLKDSGSTLEEIKQYRSSHQDNLALLIQKLIQLKAEKARLDKRIKQLTQLVKAGKENINRPSDVMNYEWIERSMFIKCWPAHQFNSTLNSYEDFLDFSFDHRNPLELPLGMTVSTETISSGRFVAESVFYSAEGVRKGDMHLRTLKKGLYAVMLHDGPIPTFVGALETMLKKIREDGYEPGNRFYLFDLINFVVLSRENYTAKCLIKVSETK